MQQMKTAIYQTYDHTTGVFKMFKTEVLRKIQTNAFDFELCLYDIVFLA